MIVAQPILAILDRSATEGSLLRLPPEPLDRKTYETVNKALEAAGGKWNRQLRGHIFEGDAASAIEPVLLTGEIVSAKQEFGAFFTPREIATNVESLANIAGLHRVLEPSAGEGNLLRAIRRAQEIVAVDINPAYAPRMRECSDLAITADFLKLDPSHIGSFDRIIMNPPFSGQQDIDHVLHASTFLRPSGRLVSIMSASVSFRTNRKTVEFRDFVEARGGTIHPLPAGAFKESGTGVNAVCVIFDAGDTP